MNPFYWVFTFVLQRFFWPFAQIILKLFFHFKIYEREILKTLPKNENVIFVANHASELDPPIITASMPFWSRFIPLFFARARQEIFNKENFRWRAYIYKKWFFDAFGAYPVYQGERGSFASKLWNPIVLLREGHSLLFFPEGGRTPDGKIRTPRPGISFLASHTNKIIVPIGISGTYAIPEKPLTALIEILLRRHTVTIRFGKPIRREDIFGENKSLEYEDLERGAHIIMAHIEELLR